MSTVVLFHSALGLRPAVHALADELRTDGHVVHTPDLFEGRVFDDLQAGCAYRDSIGIEQLAGRAITAVADLPSAVVYAGISMGTAAAQMLAATRAGARGVVLIQGAVPPELVGAPSWPDDVPVQALLTADDPWVEREAVDAVMAVAPPERSELHVYDGGGHLVHDPDYRDHDPTVAAAMTARVRSWLASLDDAAS